MQIEGRVAYLLLTYPEPSETFIAEEALSLKRLGVDVCILRMRRGDCTVVHPAAKALTKIASIFDLCDQGRLSQFIALCALFVRSPARTARLLLEAFRSKARWSYFQALPAAARCLDWRVAYVHAHFADKNFLLAHRISQWTGIPFGVTTHRYDILEDPLSTELLSEIFRRSNLTITISKYNRRHMSAKFGLQQESIELIHCGIDLRKFSMQTPEKRRRPGEPMRILNVGRLVHIKAHDVLLNALRQVKDLKIPFMMEIIGDGPLRESLQNQAIELGIGDNVTFFGARDEEFVRDRLRAAEVFVLPSRSEGLPVACIEAMAVGTPVIATDIFGIPELLDGGANGILIPPDNSGALSEAICMAYRNPEMMDKFRIAARTKVELEFDRERCTNSLLDLFDRTANTKRTPNSSAARSD